MILSTLTMNVAESTKKKKKNHLNLLQRLNFSLTLNASGITQKFYFLGYHHFLLLI